jgi:hypothetical protein
VRLHHNTFFLKGKQMNSYKYLVLHFGGGGGVQTSETVPEWARPYMEYVGQEGIGQYGQGALSQVAGPNNNLAAVAGSGAQAVADTTNNALGALQGAQGRTTQIAETGGAGPLTEIAKQSWAASGDAVSDMARTGGVGAATTAANSSLADAATRLEGAATRGAYDPTALKEAAILEAGVKTADLGRSYGARGTLGSARQNVQQGAQNAATAAQFASIDKDLADTNFAQRLSGEQALQSARTEARGTDQQVFQNKLTAEGALGALRGEGTGLEQRTAGTRLAGEQALQGVLAQQQGAATTAASALGQIGTMQRNIDQQQMDAPWQGLERLASTIYGNPSRQQSVAEGGK